MIDTAKKRKKTTKKTPVVKKKSQKPIKYSFWHYIIPPAVLTLFTTIFYYPSLRYPFQFDDLANITKNFSIRYNNPLENIGRSIWGGGRWIGDVLNKINFDMGRFDPFPFRVTNLIIHLLAGITLFFLVFELCKHLKTKPFLKKHSFPIAITTAALFLVHPVQTQTISYAIQARMEGLATFFILLTIFTFVKAVQVRNKIVKFTLIPVALFLALVSCGTKEIVIVTPFLAIIVDWFFIAECEWVNFKKRIWFHGLLSFVIFGLFLKNFSSKFFTNAVAMKGVTHNNRGNVLTNHAHDTITAAHYLISEFKVILHYISMYIWPFSLSVEYDWKLSSSFLSPDSFFPFLVLLTLFYGALYTTFKKKQYSYIGFGILWFLISIAPRSTVIPSPELICDYKAYVSSVGILFLIAIGIVAGVNYLLTNIKSIPKLLKTPIANIAFMFIIMVPFGIGAKLRNHVWSSSVAFWEDITEKAPIKARGHNNLGVALSEENRHGEAIPHYLEAIKLDRYYSDPYSNLAVAYSVGGLHDRAIAALKQAIRIFPHYPEAYNNLGTLMIKKKNFEAAEKILFTALKLRPYYGKAFFNLGRLYLEKKDEETAWTYFKKATQGDLDTVEGFLTLGQMSLKVKKFDEAVMALETAVSRGGRNETTFFSLANAYFMTKSFDKASQVYSQLVQAKPQDPRYLYNLGETLYNQEKYDDALVLFERAKKSPNTLPQTFIRYANCLEKLNRLDEAKASLQQVLALNVPEQMKKAAQSEIGNIALQQKINSGQKSFGMRDIQNIFANQGTDTTTKV